MLLLQIKTARSIETWHSRPRRVTSGMGSLEGCIRLVEEAAFVVNRQRAEIAFINNLKDVSESQFLAISADSRSGSKSSWRKKSALMFRVIAYSGVPKKCNTCMATKQNTKIGTDSVHAIPLEFPPERGGMCPEMSLFIPQSRLADRHIRRPRHRGLHTTFFSPSSTSCENGLPRRHHRPAAQSKYLTIHSHPAKL